MRKLATIQKVKTVTPIENSDFLELITFEDIGWQCVSKKGTFKEGNIGVYFEIDSFLPQCKEFEFLRKSSFRKMHTGEEGFKLRTIKLRGTVSQGLFLPTSEVPAKFNSTNMALYVGQDVTEQLGVIKWSRPPSISMEGDIIADYPSHTSRSNQPRIQNCLDYFEKYKDVAFERTVKLEGTSTSYHFVNGEFSCSSHNTTYANNEKFMPYKVAAKNNLEHAMRVVGKNVTLQGEFMGPKIQGNIENFKEHGFYLYDIFDVDKSRFMSLYDRMEYLEELSDHLIDYPWGKSTIWHVPQLEVTKVFQDNDLDSILRMADGPSINAKWREGDVYKSIDYIDGYVVHFKVISNKYLLKEK